jgi:hypothetical protein
MAEGRRHPGHRSRAGFTLIETAVASVIVAMAVLSIVAAQQAYTRVGDVAQKSDLALSLANEVREITMNMPLVDPITGDAVFGPEADETSVAYYDDLDDFAGPSVAGVTFDPPINALRQTIPNMAGWSQMVTAENVAASDIAGAAVTAGSTDLLRMTVVVSFNGTEYARLTWLSAGD